MRVNRQTAIKKLGLRLLGLGIIALIILIATNSSDLSNAGNQLNSISAQSATANCGVLCMGSTVYEINSTICCFDSQKLNCKTKQQCKTEKEQHYQSIYDEDLRNIIICSASALLIIGVYFYCVWKCNRRRNNFQRVNPAYANLIDAIDKSDEKKLNQNYESFAYTDADNQCAVCLETFNQEKAILLKCGHIFHSACIRDWSQRRQNCPVCRSDQ